MPPALKRLLQSCEYVAGWLRDSDGSLQSTLRGFGIRNICLKPASPCPGVHQSDRFLAVISEEKYRESPSSSLTIPQALRDAGARVLRAARVREGQDYAVCHPGSGSQHKCIPAETMAQTIDYLRHTGVTPVIVGGPADAEAVHRVGNYCAGVPIIQEQNLTTMAGILAGCRLFIGHDSGLTHLAGAMQISTIAIFGPTDPRQWAPLGAHVSVIAGPACSCPTWDQVRTCPSKPCLSISGSVIIEACRSMLSRYASVTKS